MTCPSRLSLWMSRGQELAQDLTHHWAHILVGVVLPLFGAATGLYAWQNGVLAVVMLAVVWEVGFALLLPPHKWGRASIIGLLAFLVGAIAASAVLLACGR